MQKELYSAAWFSKTYFSDESNLHKLPVYSDILVRELFDKTKTDLLSENHPDLESLEEYLSEQSKLTQALFRSL